MATDSFENPLDGIVEADETYIGGKGRGKRGRGHEANTIYFHDERLLSLVGQSASQGDADFDNFDGLPSARAHFSTLITLPLTCLPIIILHVPLCQPFVKLASIRLCYVVK